MSIQTTQANSKAYMLKENPVGQVELTEDNAARVEAMIASNSTYKNSSNSTCGPKGKYKGSTAYWVKAFENCVKNNSGNYQNIIRNIVEAVDRENSTHLNADKAGYDEITKRILGYKPPKLIDLLENPNPLKGPKYVLIDVLSKPVQSTITKNGQVIFKSRSNFSFATKFCHYMAFYLFDGKPEQDNFSIYDGIMEKAIRKHAKQLGIAIPKGANSFKGDYVAYMDTIDKVRKACKNNGQDISRNGLDHLLWYYYK